jgi:DNA mismatch repair ATPase MutS
MWLSHYLPREVLVPDTLSGDSGLVARVRAAFGSVVGVTAVKRRFFSEQDGLAMLQARCSAESMRALPHGSSLSLGLCAAHPLLTYLESTCHIAFAPHTLRARVASLEGRLAMDVRATRALELLPTYVSGDAAAQELQTEHRFTAATWAAGAVGQ